MATADEGYSKTLDDSNKELISDRIPKVKKWINTRRGHRQSVTKTLKSIQSKSFTDLGELRALKAKCITLQENISVLDDSISDEMLTRNLWDDERCDQENANCELYRDDLRLCIGKLDVAIEGLSQTSNSSGNPKMSLPKLQLPTFDGSPEKYSRFITQFESVLSKFNLTSFEKYTYLESQLSGSAKMLLGAVPVETLQYEVAKKLLDKAFLDEDVQKFAILDKIVSLEFSETNPFEWISDVSMLTEQIDKLKIDAKFFVQYFAWNSLTEHFKQQLISITNVSRPSLQQIIDKAFEANTRVNESRAGQTNKSAEPRAVALATTINKSLKVSGRIVQCTLCAKGDHFPKDCTVYPLPAKKLERAKSCNLCLKCARKQHNGRCFNLSRPCRSGGKWHFDYMCNCQSKSGTKVSNSNMQSQSTPTTSVASLSSSIVLPVNDNLEKDVILPTFTVNLKSPMAQAEGRAVYDPWSQTTFIKESLANKLKCKILCNVDLSVKGFNSRRNSKAKLVEVAIIIGDKEYMIKAVTVPEFDLSIYAPCLGKVIKEFNAKGYKLADKNLSNNLISDIEFMLGSNFAGVLPVTSKLFTDGVDPIPSCYLDSPVGIMLQGSATCILKHTVGLEHYTPMASTD